LAMAQTRTFAGAVGQNDRAANLLVRMAAVDAEADMQLDGLVELGLGRLAADLEASFRS
jgi:hypothetical protein